MIILNDTKPLFEASSCFRRAKATWLGSLMAGKPLLMPGTEGGKSEEKWTRRDLNPGPSANSTAKSIQSQIYAKQTSYH